MKINYIQAKMKMFFHWLFSAQNLKEKKKRYKDRKVSIQKKKSLSANKSFLIL